MTSSLRLNIGDSVEVMWLRHGEPLPDGWEAADSDVVEHHHKHHARLIRHVSYETSSGGVDG